MGEDGALLLPGEYFNALSWQCIFTYYGWDLPPPAPREKAEMQSPYAES